MFKLTKHSFLNFYGSKDPNNINAFRWCADDGQMLNAGLVVLKISRDPVQYC